MSVELATWVVRLLSLYAAAGIVFAIPFVLRGVDRIDPVARESSRGFRLVILAGSAALWPLLLMRWLAGRTAPGERNAHRDAAAGRKAPS